MLKIADQEIGMLVQLGICTSMHSPVLWFRWEEASYRHLQKDKQWSWKTIVDLCAVKPTSVTKLPVSFPPRKS